MFNYDSDVPTPSSESPKDYHSKGDTSSSENANQSTESDEESPSSLSIDRFQLNPYYKELTPLSRSSSSSNETSPLLETSGHTPRNPSSPNYGSLSPSWRGESPHTLTSPGSPSLLVNVGLTPHNPVSLNYASPVGSPQTLTSPGSPSLLVNVGLTPHNPVSLIYASPVGSPQTLTSPGSPSLLVNVGLTPHNPVSLNYASPNHSPHILTFPESLSLLANVGHTPHILTSPGSPSLHANAGLTSHNLTSPDCDSPDPSVHGDLPHTPTRIVSPSLLAIAGRNPCNPVSLDHTSPHPSLHGDFPHTHTSLGSPSEQMNSVHVPDKFSSPDYKSPPDDASSNPNVHGNSLHTLTSPGSSSIAADAGSKCKMSSPCSRMITDSAASSSSFSTSAHTSTSKTSTLNEIKRITTIETNNDYYHCRPSGKRKKKGKLKISLKESAEEDEEYDKRRKNTFAITKGVPKGIPKATKGKVNANIEPLGPRKAASFGGKVHNLKAVTLEALPISKGVPLANKDKKGNVTENPNVTPLGPRKSLGVGVKKGDVDIMKWWKQKNQACIICESKLHLAKDCRYDRKSRRNPRHNNGELVACQLCDSILHLKDDCPDAEGGINCHGNERSTSRSKDRNDLRFHRKSKDEDQDMLQGISENRMEMERTQARGRRWDAQTRKSVEHETQRGDDYTSNRTWKMNVDRHHHWDEALPTNTPIVASSKPFNISGALKTDTSKESSEEDKINKMMSHSTEMYQKHWAKYRGRRAFAPGAAVPAYWKCSRCQGNHWIIDCPHPREIKKTTGIPRSFFVNSDISVPGAKVNPQGIEVSVSQPTCSSNKQSKRKFWEHNKTVKRRKTENESVTIICIEVEYIKQNNETRRDLTQIGCSVLGVSEDGIVSPSENTFFRVIEPPRMMEYLSMKMKGDLLKSLHIQQNDSGHFEFRDEFDVINDKSPQIKCIMESKALVELIDFLNNFDPCVLVSLEEETIEIVQAKILKMTESTSEVSDRLYRCTSWKELLNRLGVSSEDTALDFEDWFVKNMNHDYNKISRHPDALEISSMLSKAIKHVVEIKKDCSLYQTLSRIHSTNFRDENTLKMKLISTEPFQFLEIFNSLRPNLSPTIYFESVDVIDLSSDSDNSEVETVQISWSILPNAQSSSTPLAPFPSARYNTRSSKGLLEEGLLRTLIYPQHNLFQVTNSKRCQVQGTDPGIPLRERYSRNQRNHPAQNQIAGISRYFQNQNPHHIQSTMFTGGQLPSESSTRSLSLTSLERGRISRSGSLNNAVRERNPQNSNRCTYPGCSLNRKKTCSFKMCAWCCKGEKNEFCKGHPV